MPLAAAAAEPPAPLASSALSSAIRGLDGAKIRSSLYSLALLSLSNLLLRFTHGPAAASDRTRLQRERGAQREKERECVEKEREERTSEAQASVARFCEIERNEVDGQAKAKKNGLAQVRIH